MGYSTEELKIPQLQTTTEGYHEINFTCLFVQDDLHSYVKQLSSTIIQTSLQQGSEVDVSFSHYNPAFTLWKGVANRIVLLLASGTVLSIIMLFFKYFYYCVPTGRSRGNLLFFPHCEVQSLSHVKNMFDTKNIGMKISHRGGPSLLRVANFLLCLSLNRAYHFFPCL